MARPESILPDLIQRELGKFTNARRTPGHSVHDVVPGARSRSAHAPCEGGP